MFPSITLLRRFAAPLGCAALFLSNIAAHAASDAQPGLLFYLSGEKGTTADLAAAGTNEPNFVRDVTPISDGAKGAALSCAHTQLLSYWAPGNMYAQRGTVSFFWRSREPVGPTEFPIFRVGYADHSSWDMVWMRIDYNGHGFDAFVTDANLARTRVSVSADPFPKPNEWVHLTLSWDENRGIRFYVNGKLAAEQAATARYDAALDQFGPHSRIISPYQVQSDYNFLRGGDIDELRIYDRMIGDEAVVALAKNTEPSGLAPLPARALADAQARDEWLFRYGWNRPSDAPPALPAAKAAVRKVEIHDAYDLKRWWWKGTDGIRETTWPGVYNRSRLPGRNDYFQLPDWDCYVESGKSVTFTLPNEPWNHVEISGRPAGSMALLDAGAANDAPASATLFERSAHQEKTVHALAKPIVGQKMRFTNVEIEDPIGELVVYNVTAGAEPAGKSKLSYRLSAQVPSSADVKSLAAYINGRHPADERATLVAQPAGASAAAKLAPAQGLPLVHIVVPVDGGSKAYRLDKVDGGLDGIAIDLPALQVKPTHGELVAMNIQVKDPLWPLRNMLDFTFSVKPGQPQTLWLDLRDRILPEGKPLYVTIASASSEFSAASLAGAELRVVFKSKEAARAEHEIDRFTQARDSYAMLVEEHPNSPKFNLWNRFKGDIEDLMRVNPKHTPGLSYYNFAVLDEWSPAKHPNPPEGVPVWAFRQVELLKRVKYFVNWWIDNRQVPYGDFGGGISDDVDLTNFWPAVALMGGNPEKVKASVSALLESAYRNGMFTKGLPTIQTDFLHSYEEGINCLAQNMLVDFGNPKQLERAMETTRGVASITGVNGAGHRHFRSVYYSGTKVAEDSVWGGTHNYSYLVLHPGQLLVEYNGQPEARKLIVELADGHLAHRAKVNGKFEIPTTIKFASDEGGVASRTYFPWPLFWSAWDWTKDRKYLEPIFDVGAPAVLSVNANALDLLNLRKDWAPSNIAKERPDRPAKKSRRGMDMRATSRHHLTWKVTGDKSYLEELYASQTEDSDLIQYINTEGSLWSDRVNVPSADLQRARLGGVALVRNGTFPGHVISWKFEAPATDESVAILVPFSTPQHLTVVVYNLDTKPVRAEMTGWDIEPGQWELIQGVDTNNDDKADRDIARSTVLFERSRSLPLTFAPRSATVLKLDLKTPGTPYWERSDLGISADDIAVNGREIRVRVHGLGAVANTATTLVVKDASGKVVGTAEIPSVPAPVDLLPKTADVIVSVAEGASLAGGTVEIDPEAKLQEITLLNNSVKL